MNETFYTNLDFLFNTSKTHIYNLFSSNSEMMITSIILVSLILFLFKILKRRFWIFSLITLPATFMHELMHFIVSLFTLGKPSKLSVFPKKTDYGYTLGYVLSTNMRWYNGFFIAMAPFLLLPIAIVFYQHSVLNENVLYLLILKIYILASMIEGSIPSMQDFKVAIERPIGIVMILGLLNINYSFFI